MKEEVKEEAAPAKRRLTLGKPAFMQGTTVTRRTVVGQEEITEESGLSKGVDALKEEVKSLGDNLSRIALELGRVREKEAKGRGSIEQTLSKLVEVQKVQNEQMQRLMGEIGRR